MLDIECFTYLNRALESALSPIVILASNRGQTTIRGTTDAVSAHGIPSDLLARLLIVPTVPYTAEQIKIIIRTRAKLEGTLISEDALGRIAQLGAEVSLRYAMGLLAPVSILSRARGAREIEGVDVEEGRSLFLDAGRSAVVIKGSEGFIS